MSSRSVPSATPWPASAASPSGPGRRTGSTWRSAPSRSSVDSIVVTTAPDAVLDPLNTATTQHISAEDLRRLPVSSIAEALTLSAGAVGESYRGGRIGEESFVLDGLGVKNHLDASTGTLGIRVPPDFLTEAALVTDGFSARYGQALSGMVNVVTRDGGDRWHGRVAFESDRALPASWDHGLDRVVASAGRAPPGRPAAGRRARRHRAPRCRPRERTGATGASRAPRRQPHAPAARRRRAAGRRGEAHAPPREAGHGSRLRPALPRPAPALRPGVHLRRRLRPGAADRRRPRERRSSSSSSAVATPRRSPWSCAAAGSPATSSAASRTGPRARSSAPSPAIGTTSWSEALARAQDTAAARAPVPGLHAPRAERQFALGRERPSSSAAAPAAT